MNPIRSAKLLTTFVLCALAACGGGGDPAPAPPPAAAPNVTSAGGTVSGGAALLTVPAGAASAPATVTLTAVANPTLPPEWDVIADTVHDLGGNGSDLVASAQIEFSTGRVFPERMRTVTRKKAQWLFETPPLGMPYCDMDHDGDIDLDDWHIVLNTEGWTIWDCMNLPKLARLDEAKPVVVGACTPPAEGKLSCSLTSLKPGRIALVFDDKPPAVTLLSTTLPVSIPIVAAGDYQLSVAATDNRGIKRVRFSKVGGSGAELYRTLIGVVTAPPYTTTFRLEPGDEEVHYIVAEAFDLHGSLGGLSVPVVIAFDTQAPMLTALSASAANALVGETVMLTATASDNRGVAKVEFFRNGALVGADTSAPYAWTSPAYTDADIGTVGYTARATDMNGNVSASSPPVNVAVGAAPVAIYVHPDDGNDANAGSSAAPVRTLAKAMALAGPAGVVWLQSVTNYSAAKEGLVGPQIAEGLTVPAGLHIKAVATNVPLIGYTLRFPAGGGVSGVKFDASSNGRVVATGGNVQLHRLAWGQLGSTTLTYAIEVSGNAKVQLDADGVTDYTYVITGLLGFARVVDTAELTVSGGVVDKLTGQTGGFQLDGDATLILNSVKVRNSTSAWVGGTGVVEVAGTGNRVELNGTSIDMANAPAVCVLQDRQVTGNVTLATNIVMHNARLERCGGGGVQLREGTPQFAAFDSVLSNNGWYGLRTGYIPFDSTVGQFARPEISLINVTMQGNVLGGVLMSNGGGLAVNDSNLDGQDNPIQQLGSHTYSLLMLRNLLAGNGDLVVLEGDANSSTTLGTWNLPGENTFQTALGSTALRVSVAAGRTVHAVGNTWTGGEQGASASGQYSVNSAWCNDVDPCDVTSGSGRNYRFVNAGTGAALRLADSP